MGAGARNLAVFARIRAAPSGSHGHSIRRKRTPTAKVAVSAGKQNDTLTLSLSHVKPNLGFDLFTIQRTNLLANRTVDPNFTNFGLAGISPTFKPTKEATLRLRFRLFWWMKFSGLTPTLRWPLPLAKAQVNSWGYLPACEPHRIVRMYRPARLSVTIERMLVKILVLNRKRP